MQNYRIESPRPDPEHPHTHILLYHQPSGNTKPIVAVNRPILFVQILTHFSLFKFIHPALAHRKKKQANQRARSATRQIKCTFLRVIHNPSARLSFSVTHLERLPCRKELIFLHVYGLCAKAYYVPVLTLRTTGQSKYWRGEYRSCKSTLELEPKKRRIKKKPYAIA